MGGKKKQKSTVTVTTPAPTAEETLAQKKAAAAADIGMDEAGYTWDDAAGKWVKRAPTEEETTRAARDKEIEDLIYKKLTGQISEEDKARVEEVYGSATEVGKSDLQAEFDRAVAQLDIGEGRLYEDINKAATQGAAERGLGLRDTPIAGEREQLLRRSGEDIARSKQLLGEDYGRNLRNFETSMKGAKSGAMLDVGQTQQLFAQSLREFQAGLQQRASMNRQMIGETFANQAFGLGNLRSRNITQTTKGSGGESPGAGGIMGGVGGLFQGIGSIFGSIKSAREFKENIEPADIEHMLEVLEKTPVYEWNYINDEDRHIGPLADEAPSMMVSKDKKMLIGIDYLGFLFGALKALNEKVKRLESR